MDHDGTKGPPYLCRNAGVHSYNSLFKMDNELMQDDINVIKSKVNDIKYSSNNLLELVNKVLDINSLEKRKVRVRESKYNTTNLFKGIESAQGEAWSGNPAS